MTTWIIIGLLVVGLIGYIVWYEFFSKHAKKTAGSGVEPVPLTDQAAAEVSAGDHTKHSKNDNGLKRSIDIANNADHAVERIFDDNFREELRNRGRLHFEKIIGENAMFLQQDLRLTTSQLNDYMKQEITAKLKEEFTKYEESITDAKDLAIDAIEKTKQAVEEERAALVKQLRQDFAEEKAREIKRFEDNMTDVINHYLVAAVGDEIDLSDQLEYIIANLEANKKAIIEDIVNGA